MTKPDLIQGLTSYKVPASACPNCGKVYDGAYMPNTVNYKGMLPAPGDIVLCMNCGCFNQYDADMIRKLPDEKALAWINNSTACQKAYSRWAQERLATDHGPKH